MYKYSEILTARFNSIYEENIQLKAKIKELENQLASRIPTGNQLDKFNDMPNIDAYDDYAKAYEEYYANGTIDS